MPEERCSRSGLGTCVTWKVIFHISSIAVADYRVTVIDAGTTVANSSIWDPGNFTVLIASIAKMSSSAPESGAWHIFFFLPWSGFPRRPHTCSFDRLGRAASLSVYRAMVTVVYLNAECSQAFVQS